MTELVDLPIRNDILLKPVFNSMRHRRQNFLCAVTGRTGSGKSYASLAMAAGLDKNFSLDNIVFNPYDFAKLINRHHPVGTALILDEAGVAINSRLHFMQVNIMMSKITQTFRTRRWAVFYTTPDLFFLDKQIRQLMHVEIRMKKPMKEQKLSVGTWHNVRRFEKKIYFPHPRILEKETLPLCYPHDLDIDIKKTAKYNRVYFPLPPQNLCDAYEEKKNKWLKVEYAKYEKFLLGEEKKVGQKMPDLEKTIETIKANKEDYMTNDRFDATKIAVKCGIGVSKSRMITATLNRES